MSGGNVDFGGEWIALAMLLIAFWGDPDLCDALIAYLHAGVVK